jgi:hypothetical protein
VSITTDVVSSNLNTHKTAFSKWFSYFGELRSICPSATLLVSSVRSLEGTEFEINRHKRNNVTMSPNRQNIKLRFSKVSNKVEIAMTLLDVRFVQIYAVGKICICYFM